MTPEEGVEFQVGSEPELAPGVRGVVFDTEKGIYVPLILAEEPGSGAVSAWLDTLPADRRVVFPNVLNGKLRTMLQRRGFHESRELDPMSGDLVEIMERLGS
jgi:hypothetical protein